MLSIQDSSLNPSNGQMHRHGHMNNYAVASVVHGSLSNFNHRQKDDDHHNEKTFADLKAYVGALFEQKSMGMPHFHQ